MLPLQRGRMLVELAKRCNSAPSTSTPKSKRCKFNNKHEGDKDETEVASELEIMPIDFDAADTSLKLTLDQAAETNIDVSTTSLSTTSEDTVQDSENSISDEDMDRLDSICSSPDAISLEEVATTANGMGEARTSEPNDAVLSESSSNSWDTSSVARYDSNRNKEKRQRGLQYVGLRHDKDSGSYIFIEKSAKYVKERCFCKSKGTLCDQITDVDRQNIFSEFWQNLKTWGEKRVFVKSLVDVPAVNEQNERKKLLIYHLKSQGRRVKVCSKMFLNTLCLTDWTVRNWCQQEQLQSHKQSSYYDRALQQKEHCLDKFLGKLNTMPSHYCRKTTNKVYLERQFRSLSDLHYAYKQQCLTDDIVPLSRKAFTSLFNQKNMALFFPRKDQCDTCVQHEVGNLDEETWIHHCQKYKAAQSAKAIDKEISLTDSNTMVITIDLQAVLLSPALQASALYYKTKLTVHNFTIFNLANAEVDCYLWHEAKGGLTSNEFASCLYDYLSSALSTKTRCIVYSEGCTYQNRNKTMAKALSLLSKKSGKIIEQKFLEKGHTQMECDSVHATIERALCKNGRQCNIYSPADYARVIESARKSSQPYKVHYLDFDFFKSFDNVAAWSSIRPGKMAGDPIVVDIWALQYLPDGTINFKLEHADNWTMLPHSRADLRAIVDETPRPLYLCDKKISEEKFKHLQDMKHVLPKDVPPFYDNLMH